MKETGPRLSYALAAAYGVEVGRESTADALAYAWDPAGRSEQDPTGTETPGFVSAPGATHIAGSRTPRSELRRRRLRRYAWAPQTIETDHPANGQGAHIAGYALAVSAQDFAYRTSKLSDYSDMIRPVEQ